MNSKNKLFGASFEQSKKIIKNDILTEEGTQIGVVSSMSFWKRASLLFLLFLKLKDLRKLIIFSSLVYVYPKSVNCFSSKEESIKIKRLENFSDNLLENLTTFST